MNYRIEYEHKKQDFIDVLNIESKYLEPSIISSVEQTIKWNEMNKDVHIFVRDILKNKIVGEATIWPLTKKQYDKFMNNELDDTDINEIIDYSSNMECYLLFSVLAIDIEYRNEKIILSLLLEGINEKLDYLISRGIKFLNMCAEGATGDGQKFIEGFLNLKYKKETKEGYKLYSFDGEEEFYKWKEEFPKYIKNYKINHNIS